MALPNPKFITPVLLIIIFLLSTIDAVDSKSNGQDDFQWHILSASNFSSQIRLHPHVLLLVTVPWCGESRSLMREISRKLVMDKQKYSSLKLMIVHRNHDKVLADSLGAGKGITLLCYRHAVPYTYNGSFRVQSILSSIYYLISLTPEEVPFKRLDDVEDLENFLASSDKAVLLFDSCGWAYKLLEKWNGNVTLQGDVISGSLNKEINRTLASRRQIYLKDLGNERMNCEEGDCGQSPWAGEFSAENGTTSANEDVRSTFALPCSFEAYKKFESFFSEFLTVARTLFLPPQRQRYGIISERSLLSPLGAEVSDQWLVIISYAGCPGCLRIVKEMNHLHALEMDNLPVMELEDKRNDVEPALPIDNPSIILFVDRTSDSIETRRKSYEALDAFREVARDHWNPFQVDEQNSDGPRLSHLKYQVSASLFGNQRLLLSPSSQKIKLKDKMSIMIINEGKEVTLDSEALNLQGGSLQEILTYLIRQRKELKLSALAKEAGFQLLSDDLDIQKEGVSLSPTEGLNQVSVTKSVEVSVEGSIDMNKVQADKDSALMEQEEQSKPINIDAAYDDKEQKANCGLTSERSAYVDPHQSHNSHEIVPVDADSKGLTDLLADKTEGLNNHFSGFNGSFFFSDGNYEFLKSLTNDSEVPRIVIIDPISQKHFVFLGVANFCVSSVSSFIDEFVSGTLNTFQRSGPLWNSIEVPHPPFVNLDFHEKDSVPCVTTATFPKLVRSYGQLNAQNASDTWDKDVLVLFSSSWCGFCQRMELVVREVYRALEGYWEMVKYETTNTEGFSEDDLKDAIMKPPTVYSIDCTLNECGLILKSVGQREVYPCLLLFPARTNTVIPYDGNMMVTDVIKFVANHGSSNHHLARKKGILWTDWDEVKPDANIFKDALMSGNVMQSADGNDKDSGAILNEEKLQNQGMFKLNEKTDQVKIAVGSFLVATKNMHGFNPFNEARILIVGADRRDGFQGLIVNKPISWDSINVEMPGNARLSFGGPVIHEETPLVSLTRGSRCEQYPQVLSGVFFLDQLATFNEITYIKAGNRSATDYWFFWGYSGWSWDQLFSEIAAGVWNVHEGKVEDLPWT